MADHPTDQPSREGDSERFALGKNCEYGCGGPCRDLGHWADRASYLHLVSNEQMDRAETAETAASTLQAAEAERDDLERDRNDNWCPPDTWARLLELIGDLAPPSVESWDDFDPFEAIPRYRKEWKSIESDLRAAEAREVALREAADGVLEAIGWGETLKVGYSGGSGDVEDLEEALHDVAALLSAQEPTNGEGTDGKTSLLEDTRCPSTAPGGGYHRCCGRRDHEGEHQSGSGLIWEGTDG